MLNPRELSLCRVVVMVIILSAAAPQFLQLAAQTKPGCTRSCGNLNIPYPFGTADGGSHCYYPGESNSFLVNCDNSTYPPVPYWGKTNAVVDGISLEDHEMRVRLPGAKDCYWASGDGETSTFTGFIIDVFPISNAKNRFTVVGCDTYAYFTGRRNHTFSTGCMSICNNTADVTNGTCSGVGCCQISFPANMKGYNITIGSYYSYSQIHEFNPCGYAFVAANDYFNFSLASLKNSTPEERMPVVLDWEIGSQKCKEAKVNPTGTGYLCNRNATCVDSDTWDGYRCICKEGYKGNPYLPGPEGCQDINECANSSINNCSNRCHNTLGGYRCSCPPEYQGDGRIGGEGCKIKQPFLVLIVVGVGVLLVGAGCVYLGIKKRNLILLKEKYFKQNGGLLLQQQLRDRGGSSGSTAKIFTAEELEKATGNYNESRIVGRGGYGTVYRGVLADNKVVAIKKSRQVDQTQIDQFVNEVIVLSQINHRNVVRLLGCCLETEVPLLVYEFVGNGTLFDHIHRRGDDAKLPWGIRLKIAAETAGVLSYLHSAASVPIIHRDIKSTNILLDENCVAKVSDFGASRLVPLDQMEMSTMVQGTLGYLDPEYLHTSTLTEKSDVYSFGVVLVELVTGKKALCFDKPEEERSLAMLFVSSLKNSRLFEIIEDSVVRNDDLSVQQVKEVAKLARRCLEIKGEERPTMKEVAMELEGIRVTATHHPWETVQLNSEETENLLEDQSTNSTVYGSKSAGYGYDSMRDQAKSHMRGGR